MVGSCGYTQGILYHRKRADRHLLIKYSNM